jgi:hypothetical protein
MCVRFIHLVLLAALASWIVPPARAAVADAEVEAVVAPAWLVRNGKRVPLGVGTQLRNGDQILTGEAARARLLLADGSTVKLGENARFSLDGMARKRDGTRTFTAALGVVQGAFRFTTSLVYGFSGRRDVKVMFATVTAGIRGTDLWGKTTADREIVALIEGKVTLTRPGDKPVTMTQPSSVYETARAATALPVSTLPPEVLARYAAETEMAAGAGEARKGGTWRLYAARTASQQEALAVYDKLQDAGYDASIRPITKDGQTEYTVRIVGLLSEADGVALAVKLRVQLGLQDVSVSLN